VYAENIWGKAMARTNVDKWSADKAADEAIGRMKTIFAQWR
jgi:multiple sugar transport system substrate-binding protein